jgi:predicted DNA-binding transcriptional regulator AlpA
MAQRTIDGPEPDWLDMADLTRLLRLSESSIKRLIDAGEFPLPLEVTAGTRMWGWRDVLFWQLKVELRPRMVKKEKVTGAQKGPGAGQEGPTGARPDTDD